MSQTELRRRVRYSLIYLVLFSLFVASVVGIYHGGIHMAELQPEAITLKDLPWALSLSFLRMLTSYLACLVFAFGLGLAAARSKLGERLILPLLDILQSIPVIGFFPVAYSVFISITGGHRLGVELAAVFLIFTSQAWNMAFAVYESTKTIPQDNFDAVSSYGVRGTRKLWKLYVPASIPRLVYNSILSWSNGWFFLVGCELIALGQIHFHLPGIGSFLAQAAEQDQIDLILWGLFALTSLILVLDVLVWRPLTVWSERFRQDVSSSEIRVVNRNTLPHRIARELRPLRRFFLKMFGSLLSPAFWIARDILLPLFWDLPASIGKSAGSQIHRSMGKPLLLAWLKLSNRFTWLNKTLGLVFGLSFGFWSGKLLLDWLLSPPYPIVLYELPRALMASTLRLIIALLASLAWILPVVLYTWNKPRLRQGLTTVAQVGASLPAIALFPLFILVAVKKMGGGMEMASIFLLMTGMQWYILFNGLSGTAIIPGDLIEAARAMGLSRIQTWKTLVIPSIRPALITGAITAWGGGWNALVVAEYVKHKSGTLEVLGIGSLLSRSVLELGDHRGIALVLISMITWIVLINTVFWRPIYQHSAERFKFEG